MLSVDETTGLPRFHVGATAREGVLSMRPSPEGLVLEFCSYGKVLDSRIVTREQLEGILAMSSVGPAAEAPAAPAPEVAACAAPAGLDEAGRTAVVRMLAIAPARGKRMLSVRLLPDGRLVVTAGGKPLDLSEDEAAVCRNGLPALQRLLGRTPGKAAPAISVPLAVLGLGDGTLSFDAEWERTDSAFNADIDARASEALVRAVQGRISE